MRHHNERMPVTRPPHSRSVLVASGLLVLVVVVVAAILGGSGAEARQDPGSAEASVQQYFEAMVDGRLSGARATFTDELAARCPDPTDLWFSTPSRVVITDSRLDGSETVVDVRITIRGSDALLVGPANTFEERIRLVETPQGWRISESPWPYLCAMKAFP